MKRLKYELQELESKRQSLDFEITPDALALAVSEWCTELTEAHTTGNVAVLRALLGLHYRPNFLHLPDGRIFDIQPCRNTRKQFIHRAKSHPVRLDAVRT